MAYGMKYTKGGFPFKSSPAKVDLTKKSGFGPTEKLNRELVQDTDDQSREAAEDAAGVTTNIKMPKVHQSGNRNRVHTKGGVIETNWVNPHAVKP